MSVSLPIGHFPLHAGQNPIFAKTAFLLGHLGLVCGLYEFYKLGFCLQSVLLVIVGFLYDNLGGLGITAGAHRLWSHKSYAANGLYRFVVMMFNCIAFQGELLYWVKDHRAHHKWSDTRKDPHNATRGFWYSHMGWLLLPRDPELKEALKQIPYKDMLDDWVIRFQLRFYPLLVLLVRIYVPVQIGYCITGSRYIGFVVNACSFWCLSLHCTFLVNSAAHVIEWGYRPYAHDIPPNENLFVIYAAVGEGHHNFHHAYPRDYATSELNWGETYNPTKRFIDLAASWGMIAWRRRDMFSQQEQRFVNRKVIGDAICQ